MACLTAREHDVPALVAEGHTNAGVVARLHLAERTVETHMRGIFQKRGIADDADRHRRVLAVLAYMSR
ncbi:helix-turn-helix transcriptional regulator [Actinomadura sp.]|uniref:helix-turn-helix transcriptional regulator n=1 Tax=Actinomadura sp. TaxID=1989 RepID=UPI0037CCA46A